MPFEPFEPVSLGRTSLAVTRLAFGGASIGGLYQPVDTLEAEEMVEHAWSLGIRHFDVAPLYGYGAAERAMGAVLATRPRDEFVLSTKVGRLVREAGDVRADDEVDLQALGDQRDAFYPGTDGRRVVLTTRRMASGARSTSSTSTTRTGIGESRSTRRIPHSRDCGPTESSERSEPAHLDDYPASLRQSIPSQLWDELRASDLMAAEAPTLG